MSLETEELFMDKLSRGSEVRLSPQEKELQRLVHTQEELLMKQSQNAMEELFSENAAMPVLVKNVQLTNGQHFRDAFLKKQVAPLLSERPVTLGAFLARLDALYQNLVKLDILEQCVVAVHRLPKNRAFLGHNSTLKDHLNASRENAQELVPVFNLLPQKRFYAKTGTNIGNGEGDGYIQFQLKNLFGGAESVMFDAVTGTKTPSSYLLNYTQPINNDGRFWWDSLVFTHTRNMDWIQSSVDTKGTSHKITSRLGGAVNFDVALECAWRRLNNQGSNALLVMCQLKDTLKTSVLVNLRYDTRDHHVTPSTGSFLRLGLEKSGLLAQNNVAYSKIVYEAQSARSLQDHTLLLTHKAGLLFGKSNVLDRFHAGGPNDVRAFSLQGLGPKSANSSVGGDFFTSGGVSLISRIPFTPRETGFRFHNFLNFGKVVAGGTFKGVLEQFKREYSVGYGFGILYNHPQTRFELNFVLPLAAHSGDYVRKGFQCGVGMSFL